jgi:addiction module RelE/StbE family toxin
VKVRYTRPALADLDDILTFIAERSPAGAAHVQASIQSLETILADHPLAGRQTRLPWLRRIDTPRYPYAVFYEVEGDEVIVHAVRHTSRRPSSMPGGGP